MAKILLVEDDKSLREIYGVRLSAEGYQIISAGDGEQALALAVKEKPDLIISDVMMPKISGFDMLDILRSTPETKNVKVIMMTALSSEDQRSRGETLGANRYLVKSQVGIEDVVRAVHDVLADIPIPETPAANPFSTPTLSAATSVRPAQPSSPNTIQAATTPPVVTFAQASPEVNLNSTLAAAIEEPTPATTSVLNQASPLGPQVEQLANLSEDQTSTAMPPVQSQMIEPTPTIEPATQPQADISNSAVETPTVKTQMPNPTPATTSMQPQDSTSISTLASPTIQPQVVESNLATSTLPPAQEANSELISKTPAPQELNIEQTLEQLASMPPQPQITTPQQHQEPLTPSQPPTTSAPTMTQFARPTVAPTPFSPPEFTPQSDKTIHPVESNFTDMNDLISKELGAINQLDVPQAPSDTPNTLSQ